MKSVPTGLDIQLETDSGRCGKLLKSELDAQAHAARTQHASFSESVEEIKPLTEAEKAEQKER